MAEQSGFFNAKQVEIDGQLRYDRTYDSSTFAAYFANFITSGVFAQPSDQLQVVAKSGMTVSVKPGRAFIDGYWYTLTEAKDITIGLNTSGSDVTTAIVCELDKIARHITVKERTQQVVDMTPVNNGTIHELILGTIVLSAGATEIVGSKITDTRPDDQYCGFVTAVVDNVDFAVFQQQFDAYLAEYKKELAAIYADYEGDMDTYLQQMTALVNEWFATIKNQLGSDAATNLQNQINDIKGIYIKDEMIYLPNTVASYLSDDEMLIIGTASNKEGL